MLPKKNRLNLSHSFQKLRTTGQRERLGPLTIFFRNEPNQTNFQASVIVPTSITKRKPTRNHIRRLIFNNFRKNTARFPQTLQIVVMVYEDLTKWDPTQLTTLLQRLEKCLYKITIELKSEN